MADQSYLVDTIARPLIEQCRREIDAAWAQIEAAREVLRRGRWLLERWAEQNLLDKSHVSARPTSHARSEAARYGMFISVDAERSSGILVKGLSRAS